MVHVRSHAHPLRGLAAAGNAMADSLANMARLSGVFERPRDFLFCEERVIVVSERVHVMGSVRAELTRRGERELFDEWRARPSQSRLAACGLPALLSAAHWSRRVQSGRVQLFFVLATMDSLPVNQLVATRHLLLCSAVPAALKLSDAERASYVDIRGRCHRCHDPSGSCESLHHVYACAAARADMRQLHGAVAAAVCESLGINMHALLHRLPADADRLHLPEWYDDLPLASVFFWFDPVLVAYAKQRRCVPGLARARTTDRRAVMLELANWDPLAGLLGIWPTHMNIAVALLLGLPDPTVCKETAVSVERLMSCLRSVVVLHACTIYSHRCAAECAWWNELDVESTAVLCERVMQKCPVKRASALRMRAAAVACHGGPVPVAGIAGRVSRRQGGAVAGRGRHDVRAGRISEIKLGCVRALVHGRVIPLVARELLRSNAYGLSVSVEHEHDLRARRARVVVQPHDQFQFRVQLF
jgi:hypothetical protein